MSENGDRPITLKDLSQFEARLSERIHDTETRVIGEFYKWARVMEARVRALPLIDERLAAMESRLLDVEARLNLPPKS